MVIATLVLAGTLAVFLRGQEAWRTNERIAHLQETARHALALLEIDLRMAGYWGLSSRSERIANQASPLAALPAEFAGAATAIHLCGQNWLLDLRRHIEVHDQYSLPCAAYNRRPQPESDVLAVRRASAPVTEPPATPRLRLAANHAQGQLFIAACTDGGNALCTRAPAPPPDIPGARIHDLLVHAYYVSRDATGRPGTPSLRRKRLQGGSGGASIQDEEIIAGVENLQVQVGTASPGAGIAFQDPSSAGTGPIVAVRVWLLVRADTPETGFTDTARREFPSGNVHEPPGDGYRRLVASTTIYLRNTRT